ncbi:hypothetical protein [Paenibacillus sp. LK1]|uniref:hypothetical protein n=1 Tax=Paenibacillus sp. LK1 TaxID=2053014 RepID=UPI000C199F67|nr:hypothetical protein [Paenibacillus sp. LK1]PIH59127.1 hypothetical protein CS562_14405 [Paenibacillus sp. LK1]
MNTYNLIANGEVVDSIKEEGRCKDTMAYVLMDRVYALTSQLRQHINVVVQETGKEHYYNV